MIELVSITDKKAVTTSLIVAEAFEKQHAHVLRDIRTMECSEEFNQSNFGLVGYIDGKGESRPMYTITRDGFTFLAMGFTGKRAAEFKEKFITAFNAMEQTLLEGTGERRQVDVTLNHVRGITNPNGLDIKYTLDLTKIAMHPTRRNLAVLERLTGIPMEDVLPQYVETGDGPADQGHVAQFVADRCTEVATTFKTLLKRFYEHFRKWYSKEVDAGCYGIPSRVEVARRLRAMGYDLPESRKTAGQVYIFGLSLNEPG